MIEMEALLCATYNAPSPIALPYRQLDSPWDAPARFQGQDGELTVVVRRLCCHKFEFTNLSLPIAFLPRIYQVKHPVI
jgi:hypothetical protein